MLLPSNAHLHSRPRHSPHTDAHSPKPYSGVHPKGGHQQGRLRHRHQTIDDPDLRAELAEAMLDRPLEFLVQASRTLGVLGAAHRELVDELTVSGYAEGVAMAAALTWLDVGWSPLDGGGSGGGGGGGGRGGGAIDGEIDVARLPGWLVRLDEARLTEAFRRRAGVARSKSDYLVEVQLVGGFVGTLHARIDHLLDGALVNAFVVDDPVASVRQLFRASDRWRSSRDDPSSDPRPFRPIKPATAQRALAGGLAFADEFDLALNLVLPWPGNRSLVEFLINDPDRVRA